MMPSEDRAAKLANQMPFRLSCGCSVTYRVVDDAVFEPYVRPCMTCAFKGSQTFSVTVPVETRERMPQGLGHRPLATERRPVAGVEMYDSVPAKRSPTLGERGGQCPVGNCSEPSTARFQCMRCLQRSVLCNGHSMEGLCPHCEQTQGAGMDAFMGALERGLNGDDRLTDAEAAADAKVLQDHFGDDIKIRIWGDKD